jgi:hypothetical protein
MADARRIMATGAAMAVFAAGGALPAQAAARARGADTVGSVFSGTVEIASTDGLLVERKQRKGTSALIMVDTDRDTVVSRGGQQQSIEDLAQGKEVIISGTKTEEGSILASKIIIRE